MDSWIIFGGLFSVALLCGSTLSADCTDRTRKNSQFEELIVSGGEEEDPIEETRQLLISSLEGIDAEYGVKLSLTEACELVKKNIHLFELPSEDKESVLFISQFFSSEPATLRDNYIFYPELSAGSVELFTGALLCMIPNYQANKLGDEMILNECYADPYQNLE